FNAVPRPVCSAEQLVQAQTPALGLQVSQNPSCIKQSHEAMDVEMLCKKRPVQPTGFVILAIGVVVPTLCSPHFVTHEKHGQTDRKHRYGQKILHLPVSELLHAGT